MYSLTLIQSIIQYGKSEFIQRFRSSVCAKQNDTIEQRNPSRKILDAAHMDNTRTRVHKSIRAHTHERIRIELACRTVQRMLQNRSRWTMTQRELKVTRRPMHGCTDERVCLAAALFWTTSFFRHLVSVWVCFFLSFCPHARTYASGLRRRRRTLSRCTVD